MTALVDMFSYEIRNSSAPLGILNALTKTNEDIKAVNLNFSTLLSDLPGWSSKFSNLYSLVFKSYNVVSSCNLLSLLLKKNSSNLLTSQGILVYHFHQITSSERIFIFTPLSSVGNTTTNGEVSYQNNSSQWGVSVSQLFSSARWLEREVSELFGIQLLGMLDRRNLLLQYGETSSPLKKSYPSVGWYEIFYLPIYNTLVERAISHTE